MILSDFCTDSAFILRIVVKIVKAVQWIIPILLIVLITFDLLKVVTGQADDKAKKEALNKAVKRMIYAVIVFLIPIIVTFIFNQIAPYTSDTNSNTDSTSWLSCWNMFYNE